MRWRMLALVLALLGSGLACSFPLVQVQREPGQPPAQTLTPITSPTPVPAGTLPTPTLPDLPSGLTPQPGLLLRGYALDAGGRGVAGVQILRAYASYEPVVVAQTDAQGYFESALMPIPGDEMVRVSARLDGREVSPVGPNCQGSECSWRHYAGFEVGVVYFIVK